MDKGLSVTLQDFFSKYKPRVYKRGQILIHADDQPTNMFMLNSGRVKQYSISDEGNEVILNVYRKNSVFPLTNILTSSPNEYFYEAMSDSFVFMVPLNIMSEFIYYQPAVAIELLTKTQEMTDKAVKKMSYMMSKTAYQRLVYELTTECLQTNIHSGSCKLPMHEYELAGQTGVSRETASRELRKLKKKGIIAISRKYITVKNYLKLSLELK